MRYGSFGHTEGYFDSPQGLTILSNTTLYVVDQRNHRVQVLDLQTGDIRFCFGDQGSAAGFSVSQLPSAPFLPSKSANLV
jgi:hypothetical protein